MFFLLKCRFQLAVLLVIRCKFSVCVCVWFVAVFVIVAVRTYCYDSRLDFFLFFLWRRPSLRWTNRTHRHAHNETQTHYEILKFFFLLLSQLFMRFVFSHLIWFLFFLLLDIRSFFFFRHEFDSHIHTTKIMDGDEEKKRTTK